MSLDKNKYKDWTDDELYKAYVDCKDEGWFEIADDYFELYIDRQGWGLL